MNEIIHDFTPMDPHEDRAIKLARCQTLQRIKLECEIERAALIDEVVISMTEPEFIIGDDGEKYRVSKVEGTTSIYHDELLVMLEPHIVDEITETKISGPKLEAAVLRGSLSAEAALKLVTLKPKKPYPKFEPVT